MEVRGVVLGAGESYELRLTGRGARGYVWTWQISGDADAVSVSEAPPGRAGRAVPGEPVERTYVVRGLRPGGRARIRFAQVRPPYPQEAPYDEAVVDVEVSQGAESAQAVTGGA
ncbi:protease inhibitor I42 family protein [Streptomyces racemochromogenes]|uniref:Protease inhibitor I42 family protein n=1 Tax=Streptomyces racemochromogenes TaxID=67353 RepID=A0ABW7PIQ5_9ACTN